MLKLLSIQMQLSDTSLLEGFNYLVELSVYLIYWPVKKFKIFDNQCATPW